MKVILFSLFIYFLNLCSLPLRSEFFTNLTNVKGEIQFARYAVTPFKFIVSTCVSEEHCGWNLFDSNSNSLWITANKKENEWVIIDFTSKRLINKIEVEFAYYTSAPYEVQVYYKEEWKTIAQNSKSEKKSTVELAGIDASQIKVLFLKNSDESLLVNSVKVMLGDSVLNGIKPNLTGYVIPVEKGIIPNDDASLPGAPRKYRNGVHKGLDISYKEGILGLSTKVDKDTKILSAREGIVIRVDSNYIPMTEKDFKEISAYNQTHPVTYVEKDFGGRQIWIDHQNGVITTYNHLSYIIPGLKIGSKVQKGEVIAYAGNSGLMGEAKSNNENVHLHFEVWVEGEFLGKDLNASQMKRLLIYFFTN